MVTQPQKCSQSPRRETLSLPSCQVPLCMKHQARRRGVFTSSHQELLPGFPGGSDGKGCACRRPGLDPWLGKTSWRRRWKPTPGFLPGRPHGQRSLVGYSPQGRKESDTWATSTFTFRNPFLPKCVCMLVAQSRPTLCDSMDCIPPGSSLRGILQARILEWVAIPFPRGSSWPRRDRTCVSCIAGGFFTVWAIGEAWITLQTDEEAHACSIMPKMSRGVWDVTRGGETQQQKKLFQVRQIREGSLEERVSQQGWKGRPAGGTGGSRGCHGPRKRTVQDREPTWPGWTQTVMQGMEFGNHSVDSKKANQSKGLCFVLF